jgi:hypothetical protein
MDFPIPGTNPPPYHGDNMKPNDMPTFTAWTLEDLSKFAADLYIQILEVKEANEQLRLDNKDLSKQLKQLLIDSQ